MRQRVAPVALALAAGVAGPAWSQGPGPADSGAPARVRHAMKVTLDPARGWLSVTDTLTIPAAAVRNGEAEFLLNGALRVTRAEPSLRDAPATAADAARFFGINSSADDLYAAGKLKRYRVALPPGGGSVQLAYEGRFDFGLSDQKEEYTRGFRETEGISGDQKYIFGDDFPFGRTTCYSAIFADGFESGDLSRWSAVGP